MEKIINELRKISITSLLIALALVTNYSLIYIPNVKLMDSIVLLISYIFGFKYGLFSAILIWLIYGTFNPYGSNLIVLIMTTSGEIFYVIFGVLLKRIISPEQLLNNPIENVFKISLFIFLPTFLYDLYTNSLTGIIWYNSIILGIISGTLFSILHQIANILIAPVVFLTVLRMLKFNGWEIWKK